MVKHIVILAMALCLVQGQRPSYAGSVKRYPSVLPQYLDGKPAEAAGVGNRIDVDSPTASTTINPADLPIDAQGDVDLVNRIKTWPKEKQPFWFLNWQSIQQHRGGPNVPAQPAQTQPNTRSFFAGR